MLFASEKAPGLLISGRRPRTSRLTACGGRRTFSPEWDRAHLGGIVDSGTSTASGAELPHLPRLGPTSRGVIPPPMPVNRSLVAQDRLSCRQPDGCAARPSSCGISWEAEDRSSSRTGRRPRAPGGAGRCRPDASRLPRRGATRPDDRPGAHRGPARGRVRAPHRRHAAAAGVRPPAPRASGAANNRVTAASPLIGRCVAVIQTFVAARDSGRERLT